MRKEYVACYVFKWLVEQSYFCYVYKVPHYFLMHSRTCYEMSRGFNHMEEFFKIIPILSNHLTWKVDRGKEIFCGIGPIANHARNFLLSGNLIVELHKRNILVLVHIKNVQTPNGGY